MENKELKGSYACLLPDPGIEKRAENILADMLDFGNVALNKFCLTHTDRIGASRIHLLIRSVINRSLHGEDANLF